MSQIKECADPFAEFYAAQKAVLHAQKRLEEIARVCTKICRENAG